MAVAVIETLISTSGSASNRTINTGDFTPNPSVGDLLIAHLFYNKNSASITLPTDWTQIVKTENAGDVVTSQLSYKIADASDAAGQTLQWDQDGGAGVMKLAVMRITGHKAVSFIAASSGQSNDASATITAPTVTPVEAESMIMFFTAGDGSSTTVDSYAIATSTPTFTELYENNGSSYFFSGAWGIRTAITATGSGTATASNTVNSVGHLVVVSAPQSFSATDTVTGTDTFLGGLTTIILDTLTLTDTVASLIARLWTKLSRNIKSWTNQNKE